MGIKGTLEISYGDHALSRFNAVRTVIRVTNSSKTSLKQKKFRKVSIHKKQKQNSQTAHQAESRQARGQVESRHFMCSLC